MKTKVASRTRSGSHHHHSNKHTKNRSQRRRDFIATGRKYARRESSTSIESQIIALKKTTYPNASHKVGLFSHTKNTTCSAKNMKRRSATAGLDPNDINKFLSKNGQFIIPFLQNQGMTTTSDEETSRASFKIQDSRLNVVLKQDQSDEEENDCYNYSGPHIEEVVETQEHNNKKSNKAIENILKNIEKQSSTFGIGIEGEHHRHDMGSRTSRNSTKNRYSRKSTLSANSIHNHSNKRSSRKALLPTAAAAKKAIEANAHNISDLNVNNRLNDSISSYSSELDLPIGITMHSSYSGRSTGKPNSRNSKTSCDVGIQANAYEIATQTLASFGEEELENTMRHLNAKNRRKSEHVHNEDAAEMHLLLPNNKHHRETNNMSESDKLKMLLLPSK